MAVSSHSSQEHEEAKIWKIEEVLKFLGFGKVQYIVIIACGMISMTIVNQLFGTMFIITTAQCDLEMTTRDKGLLVSVTFFGVLVTAFMWGYLSDLFGRRKIMLLTLGCSSIASILSSLSPNFGTFLVMRFLVGVFLAGASSCYYPYIGEIISEEKRSSTMAYVTSVGSIAYLFIPLMPLVILSLDFKLYLWSQMVFRPWRLILLAFAAPGIMSFIMLLFLPESPKYLLSVGHIEETLNILKWIYHKNTGLNEDSFPIRILAYEKKHLNLDERNNARLGFLKLVFNQVSILFKPPHVWNFLILLFVQVSIFCVGNGMGLWFTELQNRVSKTHFAGTVCEIINSKVDAGDIYLIGNHTTECDDSITNEAFVNSIILGTCCIIGLLLISLVSNVISRVWILEINLLGSTITGVALQFLSQPELIVASFCLFITFSMISISVLYGLAVLLFPTNVRSTAQGITATVGRLGTSICGVMIGLNIESHCEGTFGVITGLVFVAACINLLLPNH